MKHLPYLRILAVILFSFIPSVTKGAVQITAEITITNAAGIGSNWVVNGITRTWTNAAGTPISAWITTGANAGATASNLYSHITRYPYLSPFLVLGRTSPTNITLIGTSLTITTNNYSTISYTTNTGSSLSVVQVPFDSVVGATNRTNNAHWLIDALNTYPYTNGFKTNANVMSNYLTRGASPQQAVLSPVMFALLRSTNGGLTNFYLVGISNLSGRVTALTNGYFTNSILDSPIITNGVAEGVFAVSGGIIVTNGLTSYGDLSISSPGATVGFDNNCSFGLAGTSWFGWTITNISVMQLKSTGLEIPGIGGMQYLIATNGASVSNLSGFGTNIMRGSYSFPAFALTTLAAGNNISVPFGTNRFIRVGIGPAGAPTICGIIGAATSGGLDGQHVWVFHDSGYPVTYAANTVDPVSANRINTSTGGDVTFLDQTWAEFIYDGADGRWKLVNAPSINGGVVTVVSGAGSGNTNYTLTATTPKQYLGSSNVMITAVMGYTAGVVNDWTVTVTNLSGGTWGIGFSSVTNRWRFHSSEYGTNAPSVLTNGTALVLRGESEGTNTTVRFNYFSPGL